MIYSVMIANGNSKQEILTDKQNAEIYAELGLALAEFVPPELITDENWGKYHKNCVNNWEVRFANILYKFYCDCLQDKTLYNMPFHEARRCLTTRKIGLLQFIF